MNKSEMIEHIAVNAYISKAAATRALEAFTDGVTRNLKRGGSVQLTGFGTFSVAKRAARIGRNPRTGEAVDVVPKRVPFFKTGKELRERLNPGMADDPSE